MSAPFPNPGWRQCMDLSDAMEAWEDTRPGLIDHPLTIAIYLQGNHNGPQRVDPACLDPEHLAAIREFEAAEAAMSGEEYNRFRHAMSWLWVEMGRPKGIDVRGRRLDFRP